MHPAAIFVRHRLVLRSTACPRLPVLRLLPLFQGLHEIPLPSRAGRKGDFSRKLNGGKLFGKAKYPACVFVHDFLKHFRSEGQAPVKGDLLLEVHERRGAREDDLVADDGVGGFNILFGEGLLLVFGDIEINVGVALHDMMVSLTYG